MILTQELVRSIFVGIRFLYQSVKSLPLTVRDVKTVGLFCFRTVRYQSA